MNPTYIILATPILTILLILSFNRWIKENLKPSDKYFTIPIALTALVMSIYSFSESHKILLHNINPAIQVKPISIEEHLTDVELILKINNFSDYTAYNIDVDVKIGKTWFMATQTTERKATFKEIKKIYNIDNISNYSPLTPFGKLLSPGKTITLGIFDAKLDFWKNIQVYRGSSKESGVPIPFSETSVYKTSQRWKEQLDQACLENPVSAFIKFSWENEIGRFYEKILEYKIVCTQIGSERSYIFIPKE